MVAAPLSLRVFSVLLAVMICLPTVVAQDGKPIVSQQVEEFSDNDTIRVEVSRVPLLFTVTDHKNRFITDLDLEDFAVYDNGDRQRILEFARESDLPLRIGILVDTSNSIRGRFKFEQEAAIEFIRGVLAEEKDRAFLVGYDSQAELIVDFTNDADELAVGVRNMRAGGGTALYDAVYYASRDKLPEDWPPEQFRRALVIIGDGADNTSSVTRDMALEMAHKAGAVIYTISTNRSSQRQNGDKTLKIFSRETGGLSFHPFQARDLEQSFANIANELRHQYFLIYSPTNFSADGSFHTVEVQTPLDRVAVRARSGYYAPLPGDSRPLP